MRTIAALIALVTTGALAAETPVDAVVAAAPPRKTVTPATPPRPAPAEATTPAPTPAPVVVEEKAEPVAVPKSEVHGRIDLSQTITADSDTNQRFSLSDLRFSLDGSRLTGADLWFRVDGRARYSWTSNADSRLFLSDFYLRQGSPESSWRFTLGRQTLRQVGSAQVDGLTVEKSLSSEARVMAFVGLMPHPVTNLPTATFFTGGVGYEYNTKTAQHAGGLVVSLYKGLDRIYLTQRSTMVLSSELMFTGYLTADLAQLHGLFGAGRGPDLTSFIGLVRYRPSRLIDFNFTLSHQHTVVPGAWWIDWMQEELAKRGLSGSTLANTLMDPVGTRTTSVRLTTNLNVSRIVIPFVKLRFDVRHNLGCGGTQTTCSTQLTQSAIGFEGIAGVKVRPSRFFVLAQGGWRNYFDARGLNVVVDGGYEGETMGAQAGGTMLRRSSINVTDPRLVWEAHLMGWLDLAELSKALEGVMLSTQYQLLIDSGLTYHVGFLQAGYRF